MPTDISYLLAGTYFLLFPIGLTLAVLFLALKARPHRRAKQHQNQQKNLRKKTQNKKVSAFFEPVSSGIQTDEPQEGKKNIEKNASPVTASQVTKQSMQKGSGKLVNGI